MQKTYINATLSGLGFMGFLGSVVVRTLERIGLVETAIWLHGLTDQGAGFGINWTAISFDIFCVSAAGPITLNFQNWRQAYRKWSNARKAIFMSAHSAAMWLCYWTLLGDAWPQNRKEDEALRALLRLGSRGKLTFLGCAEGEHDLKKISPAQFANAHLEIYRANDAHGMAVALLSDGQSSKRLITGLVVDQAQVQKLWQTNGRNRDDKFLGFVR